MRKTVISMCFFVLALTARCYGSDADIMKELKDMRALIKEQGKRIEELERQVQDQANENCRIKEVLDETVKDLSLRGVSEKRRHEIEKMSGMAGDIEIGASITAIGQAAPKANDPGGSADGKEGRFDGSYSADIEIAKPFDEYGMAFVHFEAGQGDSVESELTVFSNVNRDAGDSNARVDVTEAWYEQYILDEQITVTGGKIGPDAYIDTNEYANDENTQFLGRMFRNSAVIDWPDDNSFGMRLHISPKILVPYLEIDTVYMDEDGDWEGLFNGPFIAAQMNFKPAVLFGDDEEKWAGNYRAYYWYNGATYALIKEPDVLERGLSGFGFSADQMITDIYGVFGRFGWADPEKSSLVCDWSIGASMKGSYWGRGDDIAALAVGQAVPGKEYGDMNVYDDPETHLEAYYSVKVNDHIMLTPDVQIIWQPNGGGTASGGDTDTIFVYGVRAHIDF
ncbi:MAG: carbohydrate porin [Candidatus Omnitrophota bacterium]